MDFLIYLKKFWKELLIFIEVIAIIVLSVFLHNQKKCENEELQKNIGEVVEIEEPKEEIIKDESIEKIYIKVDIKGAVKKPGVYELEKNSIVNDVIKAAGGLKSNANTSNLNLSKIVKNESVIRVFTNDEINKLEEVKTEVCISNTEEIKNCEENAIIEPTEEQPTKNEEPKQEEVNNKVSLNKATKEELMTLSGIGESKALSIIAYRNENNGFKSLEEIMNISGIGSSTYEKIKDSISL